MTRIQLRTRWVRDVGGAFLVHEAGEAYDVPARHAGLLLRRGHADQLDADADVSLPVERRRAQLSHEEIHELESDTLRNKREDTALQPQETVESEASETSDDEPDEGEGEAPGEDAGDEDAAQAPVTRVPGVGEATADTLDEAGISIVGDLAAADPDELPDGVGPAMVEEAQSLLAE